MSTSGTGNIVRHRKNVLCANVSPRTAALLVTGTSDGLMDFIFPILDMHLFRDFSENTSSDLSDAEALEEVERANVTIAAFSLFLKQFLVRIF